MSQSVSWLMENTAVFGIALTAKQQAQFAQYLQLLLTWNERMNLTAVREPLVIQQRHFLDSLSCLTVTGDLNGRSLVDVGTGAGFPGLPLKLLFPDLHLTLIESVGKKATFLQHVVDDLGLTNVTVLAERAESAGQQAAHRARYDWAVARSVAELSVLVEYLLPLCRVGGSFLAMKGQSAAQEAETAVAAIQQLGGDKPTVQAVTLPPLPDEAEIAHWLVRGEKVAPTPKQFPRRVGLPKKRPLR